MLYMSSHHSDIGRDVRDPSPSDHAVEAFIEACLDDNSAYPSGSVFIDVGTPWAETAVRQSLQQGAPVVLIGEDGRCTLIDPVQLPLSLKTEVSEIVTDEASDRGLVSSRRVC